MPSRLWPWGWIGICGLLLARPGQAAAVGHLEVDGLERPVRQTAAQVHLVAGAAVTRLDQVFLTLAGGWGTYQATVPAGAEVTDLVLWIGDTRVQGEVLAARLAQQSGDVVVLERLTHRGDSSLQALGFRVELPPAERLRVQLEYLETLSATGGQRTYRLPLDAAGDSLSVAVTVHGAAAGQVQIEGPRAGLVAMETAADGVTARLTAAPFEQPGDLLLHWATGAAAQALSWRPPVGDGYYALWLPVASAQGGGQAPALSLVVDLGHGADTACLAAAREGLAALIDALPEPSLLGVAGSDGALSLAPLSPATRERRDAATAAVRKGGPGPVPGAGAAGLGAALRAALAGDPVTTTRPHLVLVVTDDPTAASDSGAAPLAPALAAGFDPLIRGWVVQLGSDAVRSRAALLARSLGWTFLPAADCLAVSRALAGVAATAGREHACIGRLDLPAAGAWDLAPPRVGWVPVGDEALQMGRYSTSTPSPIRLQGALGTLDLEDTVTVDDPDTTTQPVEDGAVLLYADFSDDTPAPFSVCGGTSGQWFTDRPPGVLCVGRVIEEARTHAELPAESYTIQARMRVRGAEGKIILARADRSGGTRLDLMVANDAVRVTTSASEIRIPYPLEQGHWYDVRVAVSSKGVSTWVDGTPLHQDMPWGKEPPDGSVGLGAYSADSVYFDDVVVRRGVESGGALPGLLPTRLARAPVLLWAAARARELERDRTLFGTVAELEEALLDVGLTYRAVTSVSPLALVLPRVAARQASATPVLAARPDSSFFDRTAAASDPAAGLGVALTNAPNPANGSTWISFRLPTALTAPTAAQVVLYSMSGQRVDALAVTGGPGAVGRVCWEGRDHEQRPAASGVYLAVLEVAGRRLASHRLVLLR